MEQTKLNPQQNAYAHTHDKAEHLAVTKGNYADYSAYLDEQGLSYTMSGPFWLSGVPAESDAWLIHVTVVCQQFEQLIKLLLAFVKPTGLAFAIPVDAGEHSRILDGRSGFGLTGKVITVIAGSPEEAKTIVQRLLILTESIIGPAMPCAYHLSSVIAVSYGKLLEQPDLKALKSSIFYGTVTGNELRRICRFNHLPWPFADFRPLKTVGPLRLLNRQYIPIETFKEDPKGNVIKALKINRVFDMEWCVVKQGRRYQSFDNSGRDVRDRLRWQFEIHRSFEAKDILPKAIAYFEFGADAFFTMEYKDSVSLAEKVAQLSEGRVWRWMPVERKGEILQYLIKVAHILAQFHEEGFVHRDVTPANFIVTETGEVFTLDIELCYNVWAQTPNPPFTLGTPGYMSPAQENGNAPSFYDDIYSFGALMLSMLTGILPNKLNKKEQNSLKTNLSYFIDSPSLVNLIISCLDADPVCRPGLTEIMRAVELCDTILLTIPNSKPGLTPYSTDKAQINIIHNAFKMLCNLLFSDKPNFSEEALLTRPDYHQRFADQGSNFHTATRLDDITFLATISSFIPESIQTKLASEIQHWLKEVGSIEQPVINLEILASALSKIDQVPVILLDFMSKAMSLPDDIDDKTAPAISGGLAGRGLKLLSLNGQKSFGPDQIQLTEIVNRLTAMQHKDGSWITNSPSTGMKRFKVIGFSHGVAGVVYFLLSYYAKHQSGELRIVIESGLNWLLKQRKTDCGKLTWPVSAENQTVDPWLEHGFSGVVFTFIKAYEVLGASIYKEIAAEVLGYHPFHITSNYCAFGNGLSGLGEIYLEAFQVLGEKEWLLRAMAVRDVLLNSCYRDNDICYWLDGTQLDPSPDFWSGNAGVLHFLLRFEHPDEIQFPSHLIP